MHQFTNVYQTQRPWYNHTFNGVDIHQTRENIKLSNETYINKLIDNHTWLRKHHDMAAHPIPMKADATYRTKNENDPPAPEQELKKFSQLNTKFYACTQTSILGSKSLSSRVLLLFIVLYPTKFLQKFLQRVFCAV